MIIEKLSLSTRVINGLKIAGIKTDDEIMSMGAKELSERTGLGCKSLVEIYSTLARQYKPPTKEKFNPENYHLNNLNIKAWQEYCQYRKTIKKPLKTERGCKLQASLLAQYPYDTQQRIVNQTIDREWIALVEIKNEQNKQTISTATNRLTPAAQQSADFHNLLKQYATGEIRGTMDI